MSQCHHPKGKFWICQKTVVVEVEARMQKKAYEASESSFWAPTTTQADFRHLVGLVQVNRTVCGSSLSRMRRRKPLHYPYFMAFMGVKCTLHLPNMTPISYSTFLPSFILSHISRSWRMMGAQPIHLRRSVHRTGVHGCPRVPVGSLLRPSVEGG